MQTNSGDRIDFKMTVWGRPKKSGFYLGKKMTHKDTTQVYHYSVSDNAWKSLDGHYQLTEISAPYLWCGINGIDY